MTINPIKMFGISATAGLLLTSGASADDTPEQVYKAPHPPQIDGAVDPLWRDYNWRALDFVILGEAPSASDFSGRFKLTWDEQYLYLLAEITDDVLSDTHPNPTEKYWDDDCLEIFLDPDASGGDHQYNHSAFAYHLALDGHAVDIDLAPETFILFDHHVKNAWQRDAQPPYAITWEARIGFYNEDNTTTPIPLTAQHVFGFMLAYCDADGQGTREHFVGSTPIEAIDGDKNLGYKTADVFAKMQLNPSIPQSKKQNK